MTAKIKVPRWATGERSVRVKLPETVAEKIRAKMDAEDAAPRRKDYRSKATLRKWEAAAILASINERSFWMDLLQDPDPRVRLEAGRYLTDRRDGKPRQVLDVGNEHLRGLAERLAAARQAIGLGGGPLPAARQLSAAPVTADEFLRDGITTETERDGKEPGTKTIDAEEGTYELSQPVE